MPGIRKIAGWVMLLSLVYACKPVKKVQIIEKAISKKDTVQTVVIKENPKVDSAAIIRDIMGKMVHRKIDFNTFNAKVKVDYIGAEESQHVTAYIGMQKDSIILIQLKGTFLGIPGLGMEAKITPDSVVIVKLVGERWVMKRSISYIQEIAQIPFDFSTLQDMIIGNPVFIDSNVVSYKSTQDQLLVLMVGNVFKHLLTLDNADFKAIHSKLDDVDDLRNRTCDITFSNYQLVNDHPFATYRSISVAEKSKLDIYLDFKEFSFNDPLKYNFSLPKNYKRK
ncbi:MAG: DUF4292 domain-containing protein [Bacteroidota bacterium]|nr:DUF4292 domain-containing protein [Bacteroidota bacterium]